MDTIKTDKYITIMQDFWIENTTNENIIKVIFRDQLIEGNLEINSASEAKDRPLVSTIMNFPFIKKIFITSNFMAIEKNTEAISWEEVVDNLKEVIEQHTIEDLLPSKKSDIPYTLYAEMTPNPEVMKFASNKLLITGMIELKEKTQALEVPIALALYNQYPFIKEIFIHQNYISITKNNTTEWADKTMEVREFILQYLKEGNPISHIVETTPNDKTNHLPKTEIEKEIETILEEYVNPAVAGDGGNIQLVEYNKNTQTAYMLLKGACSGCPSSTATLKNGIENMLQQMLPGKVKSVEAING